MTKKKVIDSLTLWDSNVEPPYDTGLVYCWNGYVENNSFFSILKYVDSNAEYLRGKYLAWIHDIGEHKINGKRLVEHLVRNEDLSYWWLTLFVEQSPWMTPVIEDVIRLFAVEEILVREKPGKVLFVSPNKKLHLVMRQLCKKLDVDYKWKNVSVNSSQLNVKKLINILPHPLHALISISRHLFGRWPLRRIKMPEWFAGDNSVSFFSYFIHLAPDSCREGKFYSEQWGGLPNFLHNNGITTNWFQHFQKSETVPDTSVAADFINKFNNKPENEGAHSFLYSFLTLRILLRVLLKWFWLISISMRLQNRIKPAFKPNDSGLELWPLMKDVWCTSMRGTPAVINLIWSELFDVALKDIPHQEKGLYLFESQAWERALIHAWKKHGHGELIAVAHSTVRFWDLRYFKDLRIVISNEKHSMPQPDITVVNGKAALDAFLSLDFPKEKLVECEALRYEYLYNSFEHSAEIDDSNVVEILILGDYMPSGTHHLLSLLEASQKYLAKNINFTVKPHPNHPVKSSEYPSLALAVTNKSLSSIINNYDIAYSSNMTSASVDAYLVGLPVVILLDTYELNFSPLRGYSDVSFVSTPDELVSAMKEAMLNINSKPNHEEFFHLDPSMPRWNKFLLQSKTELKH